MMMMIDTLMIVSLKSASISACKELRFSVATSVTSFSSLSTFSMAFPFILTAFLDDDDDDYYYYYYSNNNDNDDNDNNNMMMTMIPLSCYYLFSLIVQLI